MEPGPHSPRRTLVGSGWLREAPGNVRALMRRCIVVPFRHVPGAPPLPVSHRMSSYTGLPAPGPLPQRPVVNAAAAAKVVVRDAPVLPPLRPPVTIPWWDDPIMVGSLLVVLPPLGLTALWASRCFSREARVAITAMMGLLFSLFTAVVIAFVRR